MLFECYRCGKSYKTKTLFNSHLKKKGGCNVKYISIPKSKYQERYKQLNELFETSFNDLNEISDKELESSTRYGCEFCGNIYTNNSYYYKHKKKCCNEVIIQDSNYEAEQISRVVKSTNPIQFPKNSIENSQNQNSLNTTNSHNTVQTFNNTQNNPNININNNITIKNYNEQNDDEILNSIPNHIKQQILRKPKTAITDLYKLIHIDNPIYRNVYIRSLKDGYGMVLKNGDWTPIQMKQLLEDVVVQSSDRLYDIANDETVNVKRSHLDKITDLLENIAENGNITNNYKKEIKLITYQFREIIKSNYEVSSNKKYKLKVKSSIRNR
jgi:hypothetical protein